MKRLLALVCLVMVPSFGFCEPAKGGEKPAPAPVKVRLKTSKGDIVIELNKEKSPVTVENFLGYVKKKHYDGTVFHRVMARFMIQGGGFAVSEGKLVEKPKGSSIKNESKNGLKNDRGTVAMARTPDPDGATCQFFINVVDNDGLNYPNGGGYTVFGKVVEGMDVADKINAVATETSTITALNPVTGEKLEMPSEHVPKENVLIISATIVEKK